MKPGFHSITPDNYHADQHSDKGASLNSGTIKTMLTKSPAHAWHEHPRLNPNFVRTDDRKFDLGKAAHEILLRDGAFLKVIMADDYRTKAAKAERAAAIEEGLTPILPKEHDLAQAMARAARKQLAAVPEWVGLFLDGRSEMTMLWDEGETRCRAMLDWLPNARTGAIIIPDYKTTRATANPAHVSQHLLGIGADIQASFYPRGFKHLTGCNDVRFVFVVQEVRKPYFLSVVSFDPEATAIGDEKVSRGLKTWAQCMESDTWPAYPKRTCYIETPAYQVAAWTEQEQRHIHGNESEALYGSS